MDRKYDLLVAGDVNPDLILTSPDIAPRFNQVETLVDEATLTIGASAAIFACGAARLGLKVAISGVLGHDFFGSFMLEMLEARGVDVSPVIIDPDQRTGLTVILNRITDRAILTYIGAIAALRAEHITDSLLASVRHLHVASYFIQPSLQPGVPDLFARAHRSGVTTSLDTNWDPTENWTGVKELLTLTDVFLPNETEALSITRAANIEAAASELAGYGPIVVVKMGQAGGMVCQSGRIYRCPALPVEVADTVGAGDSFNAGFLYGYLHGWSIQRSLKLAAICGSLSARGHGGVEKQPHWSEVKEYL
jgi:sugar/nucleoside kinase (ribokinase family)